MKAGIIVAIAIAAVAVGAGVFIALSQDGGHGGEEPTASQWQYMGGNVGSFGVTDSKTPITEGEMTLAWRTSDYYMDPTGGTWMVPSSAICVGDSVYYFNGYDNALFRCAIGDGKVLAKVGCDSDAVYSMALAYGDGKIFVCAADGRTATVVYAYDAENLKPLFRTVPVGGEQVEGTVTYSDGKIYFGTYAGDYACFRTVDTDKKRTDETVEPLWLVEADGWYNATPAFFGDYVVIVKRGFEDRGATAMMIESETGVVVDSIKFDREYASSGPTAYEGRVYIPMSRVIDRSIEYPDEYTPKHLVIRSFEVTGSGFERGSERMWESDCPNGGTQSMAVIWNGTIYVGGGGSTMGSDEPFWIIDIDDDCGMEARCTPTYINDDGERNVICTKATASLTTAYSTEENGYAVYIYLMEYGHVNPGEEPDSTKGYADIFVIRDSKTDGTEVVMKLRPEPSQFCFQSFSISEDGHVLVKNDTVLFCYEGAGSLSAADVESAIERFIDMAADGHVNYSDYERIIGRYEALKEQDRAKVSNYGELQAMCCKVTLRASSGDIVLMVPRGAIADLPGAGAPEGKILTGWKLGSEEWFPHCTPVTGDMALDPIYADAVTVTLDPQNGDAVKKIAVAKGSPLPYVPVPEKEGYEFGGWFDGGKAYVPTVTEITREVTLKAVWAEVSIIGFDTDGGSAVKGTYYGIYGKPIEDLPRSSKTEHTFVGWSYDGQMYDVGTVYPFTTGVMFKAVWSLNEVRSVYNGNGVQLEGRLSDDASVKVFKLGSGGASGKAIMDALGTASADLLKLRVVSEGLDSAVKMTVLIDVYSGHEGETHNVCYYCEDKAVLTEGHVEQGRLVFEVSGDGTFDGAEILLGAASGLGLSERLG